MRFHSTAAFFLLATTALVGCGEKPRPAQSVPATESTAAPGLTPLTSHGAGTAERPADGAPTGGMPPGHPPVASGPIGHRGAPVSAGGGTVAGTIEVAPARKAQVSGGALFVIARSAESHQVVAVRREETGPFPKHFELTAADVMMEGVAFEGPFDVTARWSQKGDAMPAPGDIEGVAKGVTAGAADVKIVLSEPRK